MIFRVKGLETQINYFEKFFNKFKNVSDIQAVVKDYLDGKQEIRKGINKVIYLQEMAKFKENQNKPAPVDELKKKHYASITSMETRFKSYQKPEKVTPDPMRQSGLQNSLLDKSEERRVMQKMTSFETRDQPTLSPSDSNLKDTRESFAKTSNKDFGRAKAGVVRARPVVAERDTRIEFTIKEHSVSNLVKPVDRQNKTDRLQSGTQSQGPKLSKAQSQASLFRTKASTQTGGSSGNLSRVPEGARKGAITPQDGQSRSQLQGNEVSRVSYIKTEPGNPAPKTQEGSQYLSRVTIPLNRPSTAKFEMVPELKKVSMASFMRKGALT